LLAFSIPLALGSLILLPVRPHLTGTGDLMGAIPTVDEHSIHRSAVLQDNACGIAAATMLLDYYSLLQHPQQVPPTIDAVGTYIPETGEGSSPKSVQQGVEEASTALAIGVTLTANDWMSTDSTHWFPVLQAELDQRRPVIVLMDDGTALGWHWRRSYPHYIVVSGYTDSQDIIFHDPWTGLSRTFSSTAFAKAWSTTWKQYSAWWYMPVLPATTSSSSPSPVTSPSTVPGGLWISPMDGAQETGDIQFAAHAYPTHPGDPAIKFVNFTIESQGAWQVACTVPASQATGDVYACDVQPSDLGVSPGLIQVSFDVYDQAGGANLAPNGVHTLIYAPPVSGPAIHLIACTDHMITPWVALYPHANFGAPSMCFSGVGSVNLADYGLDKKTMCINIGANGVFFDGPNGTGAQLQFFYGDEQPDLGSWDNRITSLRIDS
jgi:hypothetical protein